MVYFVGAGTGAVDLITVRGMRLLQRADVIIYAGSLVNPELLSYAKETCEIHDSARLTLEEVLGIMRRAEGEGRITVRLHTGDPSIYGAVREQMDALDESGIMYESCPGVSACFGAASSLNIEYTLPEVSQSLIITRMEGRTKVPERESIESFAAHRASMAVYLSAGMLGELAGRLIDGGYEKDTPAALVYKATWPEEEAYLCTVGTLCETASEHGITRTAIVLVGDAVAHRHYQRSRLYAPDFSTGYRKGRPSQDKDQLPDRMVGVLGKRQAVRLCVISFTENGKRLSAYILNRFEQAEKDRQAKTGIELALFTKHKSQGTENSSHPIRFVESPLGEWAKAQMREKNALLFIGACGIAVRATAPHLTDKLHDSPVLVMDERGRYVIPVLSGHMGGANELAVCLAERVGAEPVITTATDLNGKFAVDLFARRNGLAVINREGIAKVSARVLAGEEISLCIECAELADLENMTDASEKLCLPPEVRIVPYPPDKPVDILITSEEKTGELPFGAALLLRPKNYVIGLGCKRGKTAEELERLITGQLDRLGISKVQLLALASISQKQDEQGIIEWCRRADIPFLTYTAEELQTVEGDFQKSDFVMRTVGVDNVCERAALKACGAGGQLISPKYAEDGITIAVARGNGGLRWIGSTS